MYSIRKLDFIESSVKREIKRIKRSSLLAKLIKRFWFTSFQRSQLLWNGYFEIIQFFFSSITGNLHILRKNKIKQLN